ncbi:thioredoxin [Streptomyces sp. NPDC101209]|uniref:thioredoxin n=1 Tax=Streptomyces sp. NPDC101209 TaxID=3366129 RepID=UPI003824625F
MAGTLKDVDDVTFAEEVLASNKPILVDFWAEWCGPCRMVAPILEQLAADHREKIDVVQVNVDLSPRTAAAYSVNSIPTLNVYQNGKVVKSVIGARPKAILEEELKEFLT